MKYVKSLDGLRAVAILAVLGFHAAPETLRGGFTGVDVFFVLSGYLITSVILYDIRDGKFSFREFYLRRIQRLLPNAILMIFVTVGLCFLLLLPSMAVEVARHGLWVMFNLSNFYIWHNAGGYWGDSASALPLLHTWSLAVEEQFYLLFPLTLSLLARRKNLFIITACLSLISLALSIYGTRTHPTATFYLLPTRAWQLLLGAALATFLVPVKSDQQLRSVRPSLLIDCAGWVALLVLFAGFFVIREGNRYPGVIALVPVIGTLTLLISIANSETGASRLLSKSPFVLIGKLSYSLYLWHWPMTVIGRSIAELLGRSRRVGDLIGLSVGIGLGVIAYWGVEVPLRKRGTGRRRRLVALGGMFAACGVLCIIVSFQFPVADPLHQFDTPAFYGLLYNVGDPVNTRLTMATRYYDVVAPESPRQSEVWLNGGIIHNWGNETPRIVVIGSSHALMYGRLIDDTCEQLKISVAFLSADAMPVFFSANVTERFPTPELARSFDAARRKWISEWNPDAVIAIDKWDSYAGETGAEFNHQLHELVNELAPHTSTVILFSQVPVLRVGQTVNLREYVTWYQKKFGRLPAIMPDAHESFRKSTIVMFEALALEFPKVQLLRVDSPFYLDDGSIRFSSGRSFLYADNNHLSDAGTETLREICTRQIAATKNNRNRSPQP
jgi:peptidoglycan/LPS O-acetylase OafA/YrhL